MPESGESPDNAPTLANDDEMASGKQKYRGRLELTWTNKDEALLSREDGSYEWVPKRDHRVAEVRLLQDAGTVGEVHSETDRARDNLLIRGDALYALTALNSLPEFAAEYAGKVRLVYIDPPFNTGQAFAQYDDGLEHSVWLTMMRDRLEQVKDLLAPDGSVWVHLDDAELAYCKVMMDDTFGRENFVASVIWRSADTGNYDAKQFSEDHNTILVYSKEPGWRSNKVERNEQQSSHFANPDNDPRGPWFDGNPLGSPNPRQNLMYDITSPQGHLIKHPPNGWRWSRPTLEEKMASGEIRFSDDGRRIIYRTYLADMPGLPPSTLWDDTKETGSNRKAKNELKKLFQMRASEVFATPKPEALMEKILRIATAEDDIVLDCFGGSGTTAAVAHKMGRRWVTCELSRETLDTFTAPRLKKVVSGEDEGGITKAIEWSGGGGFRVLDVAPSMFEEDAGVVVLADWATATELAEVVAAQLSFNYEPDPPFHGQHGRMRLAVIDGHVDEAVVRLLVRALPEGQRLSLAATSLDPEAATLLTKLKSGSQARVVPQDILLTYRTPSAWRAAVAQTAANEAIASAADAETKVLSKDEFHEELLGQVAKKEAKA